MKRLRKIISDVLSQKELFDYYKQNADHPTVKNITLFNRIQKDINRELSEALLEGNSVFISKRFGYFKVCRSATNLKASLRVDFYQTKLQGHTVYHTNQHSNGYYYLVAWRKGLFPNSNFASFTTIRTLKRNIAKKIKEGKKYL